MDALIQSISFVTLAEIGDKTQILSVILAAKFKRFWPIFFGVLGATLVNHALSAFAGSMLASLADAYRLKIITSLAFIAIGVWVLVPDKNPDTDKEPKYGAFVTSLFTFFIAEMGDKTQFATITLGAEYSPLWQVILGTTLGMMIANVPAIIFGEKILKIVPLNTVRIIACMLFIGFGLFGLWRACLQ